MNRKPLVTHRPYVPFVRSKRKPLARTYGNVSIAERTARYVAAVHAYETLIKHPLTPIQEYSVTKRAMDIIRAEAVCLIACFEPSEGTLYYSSACGKLVEIAHRLDDSSYAEIVDDVEPVAPVAPAPTRLQRLGYRVHGAAIRLKHRGRRAVHALTLGRYGSKTGW